MARWIVDTSGVYATVDRRDPNHGRAAAFVKTCTQAGDLLVSNHVFDELMTLTKKRLGVQVAMQLGLRLRNSRFIEMVVFSLAQEQEAWRIFSLYTDKEWSYTDCTCLVLARQLGVEQAFTFDQHFAQMGLSMAP